MGLGDAAVAARGLVVGSPCTHCSHVLESRKQARAVPCTGRHSIWLLCVCVVNFYSLGTFIVIGPSADKCSTLTSHGCLAAPNLHTVLLSNASVTKHAQMS